MTTDSEDQDVLSLDQAAEEYGIHQSVLASALSDGRLRPVRTDHSDRPLIDRDDLAQIAESHAASRVYAALSGRPDFGSDASDRQRLLGDLPYLARRLSNADYAALTIMNEHGRITQMFVSGMSQQQADAIGEPPVGRGVLGHMGPRGTTLRLHQIGTDPRSVGFPPGHPPMAAMIGAGIESPNNQTVNLYVTRSPGREPFSAEDQMIVESLAAFAQTALESERMRRIEAELHRQAREVEAAKSEFLSMISHDLRNPIATMTLVSEQLERTIACDGQEEIVQALSDSLSGMDALVTNLLDMSRLQSGTFPMEQEQCFVADVVNDAVSRVTKTPAATGRVVKIDVPVGLPPVYADPIQLRRVIENLLTNALKYSDDEVRIAADHSDGDVSCQVADRGDGVPEAEQPQIFDKFYRTKTATSRDGVGLGLAICKSIIDSHHGSIGVKTNDHGGATFWFSLRADDVRHAG